MSKQKFLLPALAITLLVCQSALGRDVRAIQGLDPLGDAGDGYQCRRSPTKQALLKLHGGNEKTEAAVSRGLKWLAAHQMPDGGWSFNHALAPACGGKCDGAGSLDKARNAATAMALLPLLAAGKTHKSGEYKNTVNAGLYFLVNHIKTSTNGGSLYETGGTMYSHGLASIALCEAYGMTGDKAFRKPAQQVLKFIAYAQDPVGGGWRYAPRQPGDTSVCGWQLAALEAGKLGRLQVSDETLRKAGLFLDGVQAAGGAHYGYTNPGSGQATTAIGLLGRMTLGWKRDKAALQQGVKWLGNRGVSPTNLYYNYYATQAMRQYGGEPWKKWNSRLQEQFVGTQAKDGHAAGSWSGAKGDHGTARGGRIYATSMILLMLEVYYRYPVTPG